MTPSFDIKTLNPSKILLINIFGIGDVIFLFPLVRHLKTYFPQAVIGFVGNRRTAPVLQANADIDHVYVYERDEFNQLYKRSKRQFLNKAREHLSEIRKEEYTVALDFSLNSTVSFLTRMIRIPHRIGFNYKNRSRWLTVKIPFAGFENKHVVEHYFDVLRHLGLACESRELTMTVSEQDRQWADAYLSQAGHDPQKRLIGVMPGAGESWGRQAHFRRWPVGNYAKLVDKLIENPSFEIILMGAQQESELLGQFRALTGSRRIMEAYGKTTLGQLAALFKKCHAVVLNDGGPLHIAVAVGTKTVSIFGPVDEKIYGPYDPARRHIIVKKNLPCQPCYRRFRMSDCRHVSCLRDLSVDEVYEQVEKIM
jgi:lipopolysaccharide heptosyltransferase II